MVNNFQLIKEIIGEFNSENEFYFVQILQRKKEIEELGRSNRLIKSYTIMSTEMLLRYEYEIIKLCEFFNARAYIHLQRRDLRKISLDMLKLLAENISTNTVKGVSKLYNTAVGQSKGLDKRWVIDMDISFDPLQFMSISSSIKGFDPTGEDKVIANIPTKNGYHIITKPFNRQKFSERYPNIDVHTNNPTILYVPDNK